MKAVFKFIQKAINAILSKFNLELVRVYPNERGISVYADVKFYLRNADVLNCIDVGANVGQTSSILLQFFPKTSVLAIEPDNDSFNKLKQKFAGNHRINCQQYFLGAKKGKTEFFKNVHSDMNSGLKPSKQAWGKVVSKVELDVHTLDEVAKSNGLAHINFLKIDTQGFDYQVLLGSEKLLANQAIDLISIEHIFSDMYENLPNFDEVLLYMRINSYSLVTLYTPVYQNDRIGWTDVLFASRKFLDNN